MGGLEIQEIIIVLAVLLVPLATVVAMIKFANWRKAKQRQSLPPPPPPSA